MIIRDIIYENGDTDYFGNPLKSYTEFDTDAFGNYPEQDSDSIPDEYVEPTPQYVEPAVSPDAVPDIPLADKYINTLGRRLFYDKDKSTYRDNFTTHFPSVLSAMDANDIPALRWLYATSAPYRSTKSDGENYVERENTWFNSLPTEEQKRLNDIANTAKGEAIKYHFKRKFDKLMDNF